MDIFDAISNELRKKIIKSLDKPKSFSQLSDELKVESSALAFHLKKLDGLISKDEQGNYILTEEGKRALSINRKSEHITFKFTQDSYDNSVCKLFCCR